MAETKRKSGPKTVYDREETQTSRVSALYKRLAAEHAARLHLSIGDFEEHLMRTRAADVQPEEIPAA